MDIEEINNLTQEIKTLIEKSEDTDLMKQKQLAALDLVTTTIDAANGVIQDIKENGDVDMEKLFESAIKVRLSRIYLALANSQTENNFESGGIPIETVHKGETIL